MQPNPRSPFAAPTLVNLKRRMLPLATTAAALGLSGCGMLGGSPRPEAAPVSQDTPAARQTNERIRALTAGLDAAIDKLDRDKLQPIENPDQAVTPEKTADTMTPTAAAAPPPAARAPDISTAPPLGYVPATPQLPLPFETSALLTVPSAPAISEIALAESLNSPAYAPVNLMRPPTAPPAPAAEAPAPAPLDAAMDVIRARVSAHPTLNTALALALLETDQARTPDAAIAKELPAPDQKLLQDLQTALAAMSATADAPTISQRAAALVEAAKKWQTQADLTLPRLALASRVDSYGVFTKIDPKFPAGKKQNVIIYCEVANFTPRKTADGWYETRLSQQETLATDDGLLLWRPNAEDVEDRSTNQRHDFYLVKKLTIPGDLAVGKYALRMSVTDRNTNKIAVVSLPIEITN